MKFLYAVILLLIVSMLGIIGQIQSDIRIMNKNINKLAKHLGVKDEITDEVKILISEGKKMQAIKRYRKETGVGLKEAKEYIDSLS